MSNPTSGIKFDKTINLGHVFTVLSFLFLTVAQWNMMDKRVVILEEFRATQRERDSTQDAITREKAQEVKDALADLKRSVEKLSDKMAAPR